MKLKIKKFKNKKHGGPGVEIKCSCGCGHSLLIFYNKVNKEIEIGGVYAEKSEWRRVFKIILGGKK